MRVESFVNMLGSDFYTGVPDSQLKALCNYLIQEYGIDPCHHIIAANEGNCTALAAGYYLATGKFPVVYLQNSGEGNIVNPVASLLNENVYGIPCIFVVGWRGEPGIHDEPQHLFQGKITLQLLEDMKIYGFVIGKTTTDKEMADVMKGFREELEAGKCVAFVVSKGALEYGKEIIYSNRNCLHREEVIRHLIKVSQDDPVVSTTGKSSRELYEIREENGQSHKSDFLTVGSMGHCSSIALGIALQQPGKKIWCLDGDGAVLMHMGAMAVIGSICPDNLVHVVINNSAHETVGGMPTAAGKIELTGVAAACGYSRVVSVCDYGALDEALNQAKSGRELYFIEVKCSISSRADLGRPKLAPQENKKIFMKHIG